MSQEDVATGLRTVQQGLEALRDEHSSVCTTLENSLKGFFFQIPLIRITFTIYTLVVQSTKLFLSRFRNK